MSKRYERIKKVKDQVFKYFGLFCTFFGLAMLAIFIVNILQEGLDRLSWDFITNYPSRIAGKAGILSALMGTIWIMVMTAILAIPIGIGAAIYLEMYAKRTRLGNINE